MPFNPEAFIYQPHPLQQYDFGKGFRTLIETRQNRDRIKQADAQLQEQQAGRRDLNTRFAATTAVGNADAEYAKAKARYDKANVLTNAARSAYASGQINEVEAMLGTLAEHGVQVQREEVPGGLPKYRFEMPAPPGRLQPQYGETRQQIFGGPPGSIGSPFMMRGNQAGEQNPFEYLPGASAAALAPSAAAGTAGAIPEDPPPGAAIDAPPGAAADPSLGSSGGAPAGVQAIPGALPGTGDPAADPPPQVPAETAPAAAEPDPTAQAAPNPFDPYQMDLGQLMKYNDIRIKPFVEGAKAAMPRDYRAQFQPFFDSVSRLGYGPDESIKLMQPTFSTLAGLIGNEYRAEQAKASLGLRGDSMAFTQNRQIRNDANRRSQAIAKTYKLDKVIEGLALMDEVKALLLANKGKAPNGHADAAAVAKLRDLVERGIMTDSDFERSKSGIVTHWQRFKNGIIEGFGSNGLNPYARNNMLAMLAIAQQTHQSNINRIQSQMVARTVNGRTIADEELQEMVNTTADLIPEEYWSPDLKRYYGMEMPQKAGGVDASGNFPVRTGGGELGTAPLPGSLDGRGGGRPPRGARPVSPKDVKGANPEQLEEMLGEED